MTLSHLVSSSPRANDHRARSIEDLEDLSAALSAANYVPDVDEEAAA